VSCTTYQDGIELDPPERLLGAHLERDVAPLQALLGCILGLRAEGETQIDASERLDALYPGVVDTLIALGARIEREEAA
jgi:UDP-N-acetylglucosamine enolpyruvyl transferase